MNTKPLDEKERALLDQLRNHEGGDCRFTIDGVTVYTSWGQVCPDTRSALLQALKSNPQAFIDKIIELEHAAEREELEGRWKEHRRCDLSKEMGCRTNNRPAKTERARPGWVYLIRSEHGYYKIGITTGYLESRFKSLCTASPFELTLVHSFPADDCFQAEEALHALFARKRMRGEWFDLTADDVASLSAIKHWKDPQA
jgi:hypothetical protein